jgi:hypothetical protein
MELNTTREATSYAATQALTGILWNPMAHYCNHKSLPIGPILNQTNAVHATASNLCKIHLNSIHLPTFCSS